MSTSGTIRASRQILTLTGTGVEKNLADLETTGVITYRDFADEYRIWQGTDVDVRRLIDTAHQRLQRLPLVEILSSIDQPRPMVAARHSAEHNVLRVFARRYTDGSADIEPLDTFSPYDGEVLLVVDLDQRVPRLAQSVAAGKPVVAAIPNNVAVLDDATREVAAVTAVLKEPAVETDWVARRELGERLAQSRVALEHATSTTFSADACQWVLLDASGERELPAGRGSAALSVAADLAYSATPTVHNEMLNRTSLTTQGSKARRLLLEAMIEHGSDHPGLGLDGYGPEVAMYRAFLERTGLHSRDARHGTMAFRKPTDPSLQPAWNVLECEFKRAQTRRVNLNDIYAALLSPPIGMKAAVIPVFVTATLLAFKDKIAIYEHGTFKPLLTSDLSERMVRNPGHFDVKHFANTTGARLEVIIGLAERLGVQPGFRKHRVANVLAIVSHLVSLVRNLDNYTFQTRNLSPKTLKVRDVLVAAVEPDELLFRNLPEALGFHPFPADMKTSRRADAYAEKVGAVLDDLTGCYDRLLTELFHLLSETSAETTRLAITGQAVALENEVLNPAVRAFVLALANDSVDSDTDWIQSVATVVAKKAPSEWTDEDLLRFRRELPQQIAAFQRLVALHAAHRAEGGGPFNALRVTLTRSDGNEYIRLVSIDQQQRRYFDKALDGILNKLAETSGSPNRANNSLLALLGERLLPERVKTATIKQGSTSSRREHQND